MTLQQIYDKHSVPGNQGHGDKGNYHSYIEVYEEVFKPYRDKCDILEIGIARGLSLKMWGEYFKAGAVCGADLWDGFDKEGFDKRFSFFIGDSTTNEFDDLFDDRLFDVIIDDGSHEVSDQIATFQNISHRVRSGGVYIIEDVNISRPELFTALADNCVIIDHRAKKGVNDDVLVIYYL